MIIQPQYTDFQKQLTNLIQNTAHYHEQFAIELQDLKNQQKAFNDKIARFNQQEEVLNIAIMGQVKAGKSSFLNALLFNGKPVLPTAATPKTASLTRISYGDTPRLEVEFFGEKDWQQVLKRSQADDNSQETKIAKEQVTMVSHAGIDPVTIIQSGKHIKETGSLEEIMAVLNDYAGNDGKYTALVKMIWLYLPMAELRGYNIIDTPGMNDPVISRTQRTKEEMATSDVVFFLSRASNFLDTADTDLITSQLPEAGVKRLVLIAGQYDSAIEQDGYYRQNLADTEANLQKRVVGRANTEFTKIITHKRTIGQDKIADLLAKLGNPILSSTFAYGYANWQKDKWDSAMNHAYELLTDMANEQWHGYQFSQNDWQRISGFHKLTDAYNQAKQDKQSIIEQQKQALVPDAQNRLKIWKDDLTTQVSQRIHHLSINTIESLNKKQANYESKIDKVAMILGGFIDEVITNILTNQTKVIDDIEETKDKNGKIRTYSGTRMEWRTRKANRGFSGFLNDITGGFLDFRREEDYNVMVDYNYAKISDAVSRLTEYSKWTQNNIQTEFSRLINPEMIKAGLRHTLQQAINASDDNFDAIYFRNIINQSIEKIHLPSLKLNLGDVGSQISKQFNGDETSDIHLLKAKLNEVLNKIHNQVVKEFNAQIDIVIKDLNDIKANLANELTKDIQNELKQLKKDLDNQQQIIADYQNLLKILKG